jgi:O-antigen/teichoic acid export membrane protein
VNYQHEMTASPLDAPVEQSAPDLLDSPQAGGAAIRGGALRVAAFVLGTLAGVVSAAFLFRHLGVVDTGRYQVATSLVAIVAGISDLGLTAIGVRELSVRSGEQRDAIARNLLGLRLATSTIGAFAIVAFAVIAGYGGTLVLGVALAGAGLVLLSAQSALSVALVTDLRLGWVAGFELLRAVLTAALILALVAAGAHLVAFLAVTIPIGVVVVSLNAWIVRGRIPLRPGFEMDEWRALVRIVLPYSAAVAAGTLYFYLAIILVSLIASGHAVGYFGVSSRVIQILLAVPGLAISAAFPIFSRAARDDRERLAYAVGRVFEVSLLLGVLVALCLAVGAPLVIEVLGGAKFAPAASILSIQGVGLGASFCGAVFANGLLSLGRYRAILFVNLAALLFGGVAIAVLVSIDGARGAAIATAAGELVLAVLSGLALRRADPGLSPPLGVVPAAALGVALATLTTMISVPVIVSVVLAGAVYCGVILLAGVVPPELTEQLHPLRARGRL